MELHIPSQRLLPDHVSLEVKNVHFSIVRRLNLNSQTGRIRVGPAAEPRIVWSATDNSSIRKNGRGRQAGLGLRNADISKLHPYPVGAVGRARERQR